MNVQSISEIRGFSQAGRTSYYQSAANQMGGLVNGFIATFLGRAWAAPNGALFYGNINTTTHRGWFVLDTCASDGTTPAHTISFSVYTAGGIVNVNAPLYVQPGTQHVVHVVYGTVINDSSTPILAQFVWCNGVLVNYTPLGNQSTVFVPNTEKFSIGADANNGSVAYGQGATFAGFAFAPLLAGVTEDQLSLGIANNAYEIRKRGAVVSTGLGPLTPNTYLFNPALDGINGVPAQLTNRGTAVTGPLTLTTAAGLTAAPCPASWSSVIPIPG